MRNTYEAYMLVQLKDGRKFVCALNRKKIRKVPRPPEGPSKQHNWWDMEVIWN